MLLQAVIFAAVALIAGAGFAQAPPQAAAGQQTKPTAYQKLVADAKTRIRELSVEQVRERQQKNAALLLIDVREPREWEQGRIPGAKHIARGVLEHNIETAAPDLQQEIVLYCAAGSRSALSADNLQKMGYRNVFSMAGGFREWRQKSLPEEKP